MKIKNFRIESRFIKLDRPIGDSQVCYDSFNIDFLELIMDDGLVGLGFQDQKRGAAPTEQKIQQFNKKEWREIEDTHPAVHLNKIIRPRGGNRAQLNCLRW